jgi:DNA replication and repair protein RecF
MQIKLTSFLNFRNLEDATLNFSNGINLFHGKNGQGKTSVLEAIYFNSTGKSFRTKSNKDMIRYNSDNYGAYSEYIDIYGERNIATIFKTGKKSYFYNKKKVQFDEFMGKINIISFIPEDINLISGSPAVRRDFFDYEISQSNFEYYKTLKDFEKVLKIRNKYISDKDVKGDIFEIYNENYINLSVKIILKRLEYIKNISIILNLNYRKLFEKDSELKIFYISDLGDISKLKESEIRAILKKELENSLKKEMYIGYTTIGPQKDGFMFF